jgi:hypothetical protein
VITPANLKHPNIIDVDQELKEVPTEQIRSVFDTNNNTNEEIKISNYDNYPIMHTNKENNDPGKPQLYLPSLLSKIIIILTLHI